MAASAAAAATGAAAPTHRASLEGSTIVLTPTAGPHTSVVVFCHGLGDSGDGWAGMVEELFAPSLPRTRFYVPSAPSMPVTVNGGHVMPAWYDITSLAKDRATQPCTGIDASAAFLRGILAKEAAGAAAAGAGAVAGAAGAAGVPYGKMVLAGFSQGAALSLFTGLTLPEGSAPLAGIVSLSGYLPVPDRVRSALTAAAKRTPVRFHHGDADEVVRLEWASLSAARLRDEDGMADVTLTTYGGLEHSASPKELSRVLAFLTAALN